MCIAKIVSNQTTAKQVLDYYSLPAPKYRRYLSEVMGRCFDNPLGYLRGEEPNRCYPPSNRVALRLPRELDRAPSQTFEARVFGSQPLSGFMLSIVTDSRELLAEVDPKEANRLTVSLSQFCRAANPEIRLIDAVTQNKSLQTLVMEEAERLLRERGVLE